VCDPALTDVIRSGTGPMGGPSRPVPERHKALLPAQPHSTPTHVSFTRMGPRLRPLTVPGCPAVRGKLRGIE
jgi:hypothetical protein